MTTLSPPRIGTPRSSASRVAVRRKYITGDGPADQLLDGGRDDVGLGEDPLELVGMLHAARACPCEIPVRVVSLPANTSSWKKLRVLGVGEAIALDLRVHEARDEVVGRVPAPLLADLRPYSNSAHAAGLLNGSRRSGVVLP